MIRRVLIATIVLLSGSTLFAPNKYFKRNDQVKAARHSDEKGQYKDVSLALGDCLEDEIMPEVDYRLDTLLQIALSKIICFSGFTDTFNNPMKSETIKKSISVSSEDRIFPKILNWD